MQNGPDISRIAALIGDPARAAMLLALMGGQALTAGELAQLASIMPSTASGHIRLMLEAGLISTEKQGRHRYARLSGPEVAEALEALLGFAQTAGHTRLRPGPKDPALRRARTCYDHLAGELGVSVFQALQAGGALIPDPRGLGLSEFGLAQMEGLGIEPGSLQATRRPVCRTCLDWSERKPHLAGAAGAALLTRFKALGWMKPEPSSRALRVSVSGERALPRLLKAFQGGARFQL